jgi:hypothetical protein
MIGKIGPVELIILLIIVIITVVVTALKRFSISDSVKEKVIKELSLQIARAGIPFAKSYASLFIDIAKTNAGINVNQKMMDIALKHFAFLMWFYANGIWSNLRSKDLRKSLMDKSAKHIVHDVAYAISSKKLASQDIGLVAEVASELERNKIRFVKDLSQKVMEGYDADSNSALFIVLEWLQYELKLSDLEMMHIVPSFSKDSRVIDSMGEIEKIAYKAIIAERNGFK